MSTTTVPSRAWGLPAVLDFFKSHRQTTKDVYPSEWFFLQRVLSESMSVLDIGCAQGGFATILEEHLKSFDYVGADISEAMIQTARERHPTRTFVLTPETDLSVLGGRRFDVVLCLGILHLNEKWRELIAQAWAHTDGALILDLREGHAETVEDIKRSYFKMDFNGGDESHSSMVLPYNVINSSDALATLKKICHGYSKLERYGYERSIRDSAVSTYSEVMMSTYMIQKK